MDDSKNWDLEKKILETKKLEIEIENLKKNSLIKIQGADLILKVLIAAATIYSAAFVTRLYDLKSVKLNNEISEFEERKSALHDSLVYLNDSIKNVHLLSVYEKRKNDSIYSMFRDSLKGLSLDGRLKISLLNQLETMREIRSAPKSTRVIIRDQGMRNGLFKTDTESDSIREKELAKAYLEGYSLVTQASFVNQFSSELYLHKYKDYKIVTINKINASAHLIFSFSDGSPIFEWKFLTGIEYTPIEIPYSPERSGFYSFNFSQASIDQEYLPGFVLILEK